MPESAAVTAFREAIRAKKKTARVDPDLALVAHCVAMALSLNDPELAAVTAGVRAGIAKGTLKVSVPHDAAGKIDETKLPPLPKLPPVAPHPERAGTAVSARTVTRLIATCATLSPKELTLVTQGVREGLARRPKAR
jgi:hypothetical protein